MILFSHFSLLVLAVAIVSFVALIEVSRSNLSDHRRTWLKSHLGCTVLFNLVLFADHSTYALDVRYFYILRYPTVLLIALSYVELSYAAAGYAGTLHRKIFRLVAAVACTLWAYGLYVAVSTGVSYYSHAYNILLPLPILLFCWPGLLFWFGFRRQGITITPFSDFKVLWSSFTSAQKAAFAFWGVALLRILSTTTPVLERITNLPQEATWTMFYVNNILTLSAMTIIFHAYIEKRANLASRIANVSTVTLLTAFVAVVLVSYTDKLPVRGSDAGVISENSLEFIPTTTGYKADISPTTWERVDALRIAAEPAQPINIELPYEFPFYGKTYRRLILYPDGQVVLTNDLGVQYRPLPEVKLSCIYDQPVIAAFCLPNSRYAIFTGVSDATDTFVISWADDGPGKPQQQDFVVQLVLFETGTIRINFANVPIAASVARHNAIGIHNGTGVANIPQSLAEVPIQSNQNSLWFDFTLGRRVSEHEKLRPMVIFISLATLLLLFVIRPYVASLIVVPLQNIRHGLKAVDEGRFDKKLDVRPGDEFSDIATSFNTMISSLDQARQRVDEQTEILEAEITFRTRKAAKSSDPNLLSKDQVFERKLEDAIKANLGDFNFQVAELADVMAVSTRQLHRRVVSLTTHTPAALIRHYRLEYGHQLLSAKAANVSEAAYSCGFKDVGYFAKLFQKKYGQAPSDLLSA